jgi:hypothetical protein
MWAVVIKTEQKGTTHEIKLKSVTYVDEMSERFTATD